MVLNIFLLYFFLVASKCLGGRTWQFLGLTKITQSSLKYTVKNVYPSWDIEYPTWDINYPVWDDYYPVEISHMG